MSATSVDSNDARGISRTFLALAPPHWAARGLSYAIIATVLIGAIAAVIIKLPETVTANFVLVPARGTDPIKTTRQGIVNQVFVSEGQSVNQGDLIVTLRSESAGDRAAELMTTQTQLAGAGESFINTKARFTSQTLAAEQETRKLAARVEHLEGLIALKRQQLALLKQMTESYEKLYREGIASRAQLTEKQLEVAEMSAELEKLIAEQGETRAAIEKLKIDSSARQVELKEVERTYREATAISEIRSGALRKGLAGSDGDEIRLTAPCAGTILRLHVKSSGAVLHEGFAVAELACAGETLQAELSVPESGVGKLKTGQGVKLKYDAFPYQRYGVRYGSVAWLSPAAVESNQGATFKSHVELVDREILVQGQPRSLFAGMTGKAEIVIGNRSLIEYVFEPLRQLKENFSDVPAQISKR
ncbi:MAG TPA: HlyD family efflux transporter periplasmic adaptor subunit [Blastocatellia bacterium]|nr:HlyD family efflux transporter periplasmic adaptor subunit [Blastocatellia bacterium]